MLLPFRKYASSLQLREGILSFQRESDWVPVVSHFLLVEVAIHVHYHNGHLGKQKLLDVLRGVV